ncbi:MAG: PrsW family glutamic-type intramembrane protease, partial [Planctomycetota bacterium]|nr:PrsW family glutamic-type intramembrane protease [Planctomycetota bacterium]
GAGEIQVLVIRSVTSSGHLITNNMLAWLAGSTEEFGKLLVPLTLAVMVRKHMEEPIDGILYGAFAGLGAALAESVLVLGWSSHTPFLPAQEPIRLAGHLVMGGIGSFGVGLLIARSARAWFAIVASFAAAMILHALWDVVAFDAADHYEAHSTLETWHTASPIAIMVVGLILFRWMVEVASRQTRVHLQVCDVATRRCPPY